MNWFNENPSRSNRDYETNNSRYSKEQRGQNYGNNLQPALEELGKQFKGLYDNCINEFGNTLQELLHYLPLEPDIFPEMTYEEAIRYFVAQRPLDPKVAKGVMLKNRHLKGDLFIQAFLDNDNHLVCQTDGTPHGRQVIVEQFDNELAETFGNQDMVIVE